MTTISMPTKSIRLIILGSILLLILSACQAGLGTPSSQTSTVQASIPTTLGSSTSVPTPASALQTSQTDTAASPFPTLPVYPEPLNTPSPAVELGEGLAYPAPLDTPSPTEGSEAESSPYPGPGENPPATLPAVAPPATVESIPSQIALTPTLSTPGVAPSPTSFPTEYVGAPAQTPPPANLTVTIWHSWDEDKTQMLQAVIREFQKMAPLVAFDVLVLPHDELYERYADAVYKGDGPSLLLGPSEWGPPLFDQQLVADLKVYASEDFLATLIPSALSTGEYRGALISLPHALRGVLLFRNTQIMALPPATLELLQITSENATRGGNLGAYLEISAPFSAAHLEGIGGSLMDENYLPAFNDERGVAWLLLLDSFNDFGVTAMNSNRDVELFEQGIIGTVIDGSWNIQSLSDAIGADHLAIDPWPAVGEESLSGYLQADSLFLNPGLTGERQLAALQFMGFMLDKNVQALLAEVGFIPAVSDAQPRNELFQQAMQAFTDASIYPLVPDERILTIYWDALNAAIREVTEEDISPEEALLRAYELVLSGLLGLGIQP